MMIEREKTYLIKYLPKGLEECEFKEMKDTYIPQELRHPTIRIRKNGTKYEITKKEPINNNDSSEMKEETIKLRKNEYETLTKIKGKVVEKKRYTYKYQNQIAEIDVFQGELKGLVLVDFEFKNNEEKDSFEMPEFCLADVTQEEFIAGGMLCGKSYTDIEERLLKYKYKKQFIDEKP